MREPSDSARVLLVEGVSDKHVVRHIWLRLSGAEPPFSIIEKNGLSNLLAGLPAEIKVSGRDTVGILVDANQDAKSRWQAITDRLKEAEITESVKMTGSGAVIDGTPRVGIWLMPDNSSSGELEDFCARLIPAGNDIWRRAVSYIEGIPKIERQFKPNKELRAKVYAWLAAQKEPRRLGEAIRAGDLNPEYPLAKSLYDWLRRLFLRSD